jgi:Butirosin biosynthesis protein H, N-terminal/Domain of unknown function (DUF4872)
MTKQKHLKARVRERMSKTGESYASARRKVVLQSPMTKPSSGAYVLRGGIHPDTAAVANVLANHGVVGAHSDQPLSEAMVLGVGGGLGAGYILWQFRGRPPIVTLAFRNGWQYPDRWLQKTCRRLGSRASFELTSGSVTAMRALRQALEGEGPRPLAWIDAQEIGYWHLPEELSGYGGYPVVVYDESGGRFFTDDRNSEALTVDSATLQTARGRVSSYRNRLAVLEAPREISSNRLVEAVSEGLADQVEHLSAASDSFSLPAWRKWARMLVDSRNKKAWPNAFEGQMGLFGSLLTIYESIESSGYEGGSLRELYAAFLDEAAALLGLRELDSIADGYRELGGVWSRLAETAASGDREPFAPARRLIDSLHEQVLEEGDAGRSAAEEMAEEIWKLRAEMRDVAPLDPDEFTGLLQELSSQVDAIYKREHDLIMRLNAVIDR